MYTTGSIITAIIIIIIIPDANRNVLVAFENTTIIFDAKLCVGIFFYGLRIMLYLYIATDCRVYTRATLFVRGFSSVGRGSICFIYVNVKKCLAKKGCLQCECSVMLYYRFVFSVPLHYMILPKYQNIFKRPV